jgi:hypothetical protein
LDSKTSCLSSKARLTCFVSHDGLIRYAKEKRTKSRSPQGLSAMYRCFTLFVSNNGSLTQRLEISNGLLKGNVVEMRILDIPFRRSGYCARPELVRQPVSDNATSIEGDRVFQIVNHLIGSSDVG